MVAVTVTFVSAPAATARQISAVPFWVLVRLTNAQVRPAPVMPVTVVFVPTIGASAETNASSSSFVEVVENAAVTIVVALAVLSLKTTASVDSVLVVTAVEVKLTLATLAPFTVTACMGGVKLNPALLGVTV